jgi:NagD protein
MRDLEIIRKKHGFISDMDGVIYHGSTLLPGVKEFVSWLQKEKKQFLFLTNASNRTPQELHAKLLRMGIDIDPSHFYTSALATAQFLKNQAPGCSAYVIGAPGLLNALYDVGITFNDVNPEYVVVGETISYNYEMIIKATELLNKGAKLIATNSDLTGPSDRGIIPACRALVAPIELATDKQAYFIGKPNPLMMRTGLKLLGVHSEDAVMIGDRMDTDIVAGVETGLETVLVLSGVTTRENMKRFSYRPHYILDGIGDIVPRKKG